MNIYSILPLVISLLLISLGIFVYLKNRKKILNKIFLLITLVGGLWLFSYSIAYGCKNDKIASLWLKIGYSGVIFIPITTFHYTLEFLKIRKLRLITFLAYLFGFTYIPLLWLTPYLIKGVYKFFWGYYPRAGIFHPVFLISFIGLVSFSFTLWLYFLLFRKNKVSSLEYMQIKYVFSAFFIYNFASVDFLSNYGIQIYPFGYLPSFIFCFMVAYSIIKTRLMDIRIAFTRASIFILVYSFIFALPIWVGIKTQAWLWAIVLMGILSPVGIFAYSHLRQQIENVLFREQQRYQEAIKDLARRMTHSKEVDELFMEIVAEVYSVVQPQFLGLYTFSTPEKAYILSRHYLPKDYSFDKQIPAASQLIITLSKNKRPILAESASFVNLPLETLIVPFFSEGELFGFLVLGQKSSKMMYTDSDFVTFDILSSQVSLALENAKHLQELKYSQLELLRQENLKFVQVLVKGIAHEILNPLTPLMHRIEDLEGESLLKLYELYENSGAKFDKEEKEKFKEAILGLRDSTKSLKNNAEHIRLIVDTLNKMQKGDETTIGPLDLKSFFKDVVPMLALEVEPRLQEGVTINEDIARDIPPIKGNPTLLKQIFINLYKNSCEAMKNSIVKTINIFCKLNPENPKEVLIDFSDTGPGMSSAILSKIFTHGFTTKGTKGSGIGLSQCRAIIEKFGGTIDIESKQNQGTKFIIKLPILREEKNVS